MIPAARAAAALVSVSLGLTACAGSSSGGASLPKVSAFTQGTCRVVAPDLLQIARDARRLGTGGNIDATVLTGLTRAQTGLSQVASGAEPAYQPALSKVVVSVGLVRLQARVGSYTTAQGRSLQADDAAAIAVCTRRPGT